MPFYFTVTSGADEGESFRIDPGECLIGRSPTSTIVLRDESVAWEHAMVTVEGSRATLQNLSALGTSVRGRRVAEPVRLGNHDEIRLSDDCTIVFQQRLGRARARSRSRSPIVLLAVALLVIIGGGILFLALQPSEPPPRPVTARHWRQAHLRIEDRLEQWAARGELPDEALALYQEAWRLEQAVNPAAAAAAWQRLRSLLLTMPLPGPGADGRTIAESAGTTPKALGVIMGWDLETSSTDFRWNTDEAYADALTWFVRRRAERSRKRAEGET